MRFIDPAVSKQDSEVAMEERRKAQNGRGERRKGDASQIADALKRRGRISLRVHGTTMLPLVRPGDIALIRRDKLENMRSGDVVLFQRGDHLYAQRIGEAENHASESALSSENQKSSADSTDGQEECLGQIVRLHRKSEKIELKTTEKTPVHSLVSFAFRPARWAKQTLRLSDETSG